MRISHVVLLGTLSVGGCTSVIPLGQSPTIPVAKVVNDLKCELALFLRHPSIRRNLGDSIFGLDPTQMADGTLSLKTVVSSQGQLTGATSGVLPLGLGSTILPSVNVSVAPTSTVETNINIVLFQRLEGKVACPDPSTHQEEYVGSLAEYLVALAEQEKDINNGSPFLGVKSIKLSTEFGVVWKGDVNAKLAFVPLTLAPDVSASRSDVQHLDITFRTALSSPKLGIPKKFHIAGHGRRGRPDGPVVRAPPDIRNFTHPHPKKPEQ